MFFGDWYTMNIGCQGRSGSLLFPLLPPAWSTASYRLWLRQCHSTMPRKSSWSSFPTPEFTPSITLAPSLQNPMKIYCSNSVVKPLLNKQFISCSLIWAADRLPSSIRSNGKAMGFISELDDELERLESEVNELQLGLIDDGIDWLDSNPSWVHFG